jgi:beta-phosphoglucomutase-like phosphatase (HAD superfamily)
MHVRGQPSLRLDGGEVLDVVAEKAAEVLDHPVKQRREVDRVPCRPPISRQASAAVQRALTALELEAVASSRPTPGAAELIKETTGSGRTVAIVSNNSGAAIRADLHLHDLTGDVALIVGRDDPDPDLMKPSPYLVRAAVGILDTIGAQCAFIGDSASDILAGKLAGVPVIGYAATPAKQRALTDAGAAVLATSMAEIRTALSAAPPIRVAELRHT